MPVQFDNEYDIPVRIIRDTRNSIIPRRKRRQQTEKASSLDDGRVRLACGAPMQVSDAEEQERHVEGEEEEEEGDGGAEGAEEEDGGEDEQPWFW